MASANNVRSLSDDEVDQLWTDFHAAVNMTSRELEEWLRTTSSTERAEPFPDEAGSPTGQHVVQILGKRKHDLDEDDVAVMQAVVTIVDREVDVEKEPYAGEDDWRRRLMTIGHDPLKPPVR